METIFKVGDKVFDIAYGWGVVANVHSKEMDGFPIEVYYEGYGDEWYTSNGCSNINGIPVLAFSVYSLNGFNQERPELLPKKGDIVWVRNTEKESWIIAHFLYKNPNGGYKVSWTTDNEQELWAYEQLTTKNPYEYGNL